MSCVSQFCVITVGLQYTSSPLQDRFRRFFFIRLPRFLLGSSSFGQAAFCFRVSNPRFLFFVSRFPTQRKLRIVPANSPPLGCLCLPPSFPSPCGRFSSDSTPSISPISAGQLLVSPHRLSGGTRTFAVDLFFFFPFA